MIAAALYPRQFGHAEAIRLFLERYHLVPPGACGRQGPRLEGGDARRGAAGALVGPRDALAANNPGQARPFGKALRRLIPTRRVRPP